MGQESRLQPNKFRDPNLVVRESLENFIKHELKKLRLRKITKEKTVKIKFQLFFFFFFC